VGRLQGDDKRDALESREKEGSKGLIEGGDHYFGVGGLQRAKCPTEGVWKAPYEGAGDPGGSIDQIPEVERKQQKKSLRAKPPTSLKRLGCGVLHGLRSGDRCPLVG